MIETRHTRYRTWMLLLALVAILGGGVVAVGTALMTTGLTVTGIASLTWGTLASACPDGSLEHPASRARARRSDAHDFRRNAPQETQNLNVPSPHELPLQEHGEVHGLLLIGDGEVGQLEFDADLRGGSFAEGGEGEWNLDDLISRRPGPSRSGPLRTGWHPSGGSGTASARQASGPPEPA